MVFYDMLFLIQGESMDIKTIMGLVASAIAIAAIVRYIVTIIKGKTRPHLFSWAIWSILNSIAFAAQIVAGAGPGAWMTGISSIGNLVICYFAWRCYHTLSLNRWDWISFAFALSAIPLWLLTNEPLAATILVTLITLAAYIPTMKKIISDPWSENILSSSLHGSKRVFSIMAIVHYNPTTLLYQSALVFADLIMVVLMLCRRRKKAD